MEDLECVEMWDYLEDFEYIDELEASLELVE